MTPLFSATKTRPSGENSMFVGLVSPLYTICSWKPVGNADAAAGCPPVSGTKTLATSTAARKARTVRRRIDMDRPLLRVRQRQRGCSHHPLKLRQPTDRYDVRNCRVPDLSREDP